jgi:tRNA threonylcarbamoyladenosine biosynthesis protein TsaB
MSAERLLLIETSGAIGSVALAVGSAVEERTIATPREQTGRILGLIDELLREAGLKLAGLDALAFGRGPGSFTGLRVAAAVTQGLSLAADRPIVSVSSLAALAQRALTARAATDAEAALPRALCCVDARMGEVYSGVYRLQAGLAAVETVEANGAPATVAVPAAPFIALGDGFAAYADALAGCLAAATAVDPALVPRARDLLPLARAAVARGDLLEREAALPVYLRGPDAWQRR